MKICNSCKNCVKAKHRPNEEKTKLKKRINTIEGQIKGIKQMLENDRDCNDILIQISAVNNGLKSLGNYMLQHHMKTCMADEIKKDNLTIIDDIMNLMHKIN